MSQQSKKIDYINIDCDSNYYNTLEQVKLRNLHWFLDSTSPSKLRKSTTAVGFFSNKKISKDDLEILPGSSLYETNETVFDSSGNPRKILASNIDIFSGSIIDGYRSGVEITQEKHWASGLAKITAGTPGHLVDKVLFGVSDFDLVSKDIYYETDSYDPVSHIFSGDNTETAIAYADASDTSILSMNGTIEPFPIRSIIFGTSINFPFEPQGVRGEFGNGNANLFRSCDQTLSVHEREDLTNKKPVFYLDVVDMLSLTVGDTVFSASSIGVMIGYVSNDVSFNSAFTDEIHPRGNKLSTTYDDDLIAIVEKMKPRQTSYLGEKEFTGACGFSYDQTPQGTDSIAFGGLLY